MTLTSPSQAPQEDASACQHCGALVYPNTLRCRQCNHFPIKLHLCPKCKSISTAESLQCWKCGKPLPLDEDFL